MTPTLRRHVALGGALAAVGLYFLLPSAGLAQAAVLLSLWSAAAVSLVRAGGRERAGPGLGLLMAGQAIYGASLFAWYVPPVGRGHRWGYPSVVDVGFFASYALFSAFLLRVLREQSHGLPPAEVRSMRLDALIPAVATGAAAQAFLVERASSGGLTWAAAASIAYVIFLVALTALGLQLVRRGALSTTPGLLLMGWLLGELLGATWYARVSLTGSFRYGHPLFAAWMLSYVALGALAVHLRTDPVVSGSLRHIDPRRGMAWSAVALAVPLGLLAFSDDPRWSWERGAHAAWAVLAVGLVLARNRGLSHDVATERALRADLEQASRDLRHAATHDPLTGLANRSALEAALGRAMVRRRDPGRVAALLILDINAFKAVNDTYGHPAGDQLLCAIGSRVSALTRSEDLVARMGGDELAVVVDDAEVRTALVLAERIVGSFEEEFELVDATVVASVSVGLHLTEIDEPRSQAMARADAALYAAKATGGGFEVFDPDRHRQFLERHRIDMEVRAAPARNQLVLHYQPIVELATRRVVSVEALLRWDHPDRGLLGPAGFIAVAEESGAIVEIGRWVLRQACLDARSWQVNVPGAGGIGVAVNVSRRQLQSPSVTDDVSDALSGSGLRPGLLTVEITETALMNDSDLIVALLHRFQALGVELAMDDFGTGYSSLSELRTLPIDVLKIDKAFVDGIAKEPEEWALAAAIVRLAGSLGKRTLAEGIERASQLAHLRSLGCEFGQGYLFARPMPLADLEDYLRRGCAPLAASAELRGQCHG